MSGSEEDGEEVCWKCGGDQTHCYTCGERETHCECSDDDRSIGECDVCAVREAEGEEDE